MVARVGELEINHTRLNCSHRPTHACDLESTKRVCGLRGSMVNERAPRTDTNLITSGSITTRPNRVHLIRQLTASRLKIVDCTNFFMSLCLLFVSLLLLECECKSESPKLINL